MCLAIPGKVIELKNDRARVSMNGVEYEAGITLMEDLNVGDWVLIHAGFILEKLDPQEAELNLEAMRNYSNLMESESN